MRSRRTNPQLLAVCVCAVVLVPGIAQGQKKRKKEPVKQTVFVPLNGTKHVRAGSGSLTRVSVASDLAEVDAFPPNELIITGKRLGTTAITVWRGERRVEIIEVIVGYPHARIAELLAQAMPTIRDLKLEDAGTHVIIHGEVDSTGDVERAEEIVRGFLPKAGNKEAESGIVNLLRVAGKQQVQLEVSFAEVSRSALKQVGINLWHRSRDNFTAGLLGPQTTPRTIGTETLIDADPEHVAGETTPLTDSNTPVVLPPVVGAFSALFSLGNDYEFPFAAALSVLANKGYARTLSEPTLVAMSGKKATFLAGGEFPLPLPQALGQVTIEFKKFGVQLEFVPTVVDDTIQLAVDMTVSDLDFSLGIKLSNVTVPGLTKRHSATTVRLKDGQSFVIAGLLSDKVRSNIDKVPWLGDIPVLGTLFRSTRYQREETELLVVVTARLVRPQGERPILPGEFDRTDPSDLELFFLGTHESKPSDDAEVEAVTSGGGQASAGSPSGPVGFRR